MKKALFVVVIEVSRDHFENGKFVQHIRVLSLMKFAKHFIHLSKYVLTVFELPIIFFKFQIIANIFDEINQHRFEVIKHLIHHLPLFITSLPRFCFCGSSYFFFMIEEENRRSCCFLRSKI